MTPKRPAPSKTCGNAHQTKRSKVVTPTLPVTSGTNLQDTYQATGLKASLHGVSYQLKVAQFVLIQASIFMKEDHNFICEISSEDPEAGKFDDIVFRYTFKQVKYQLSFQAKHKSPVKNISWKDLTTTSLKDAPYAITKYFTSFLEQEQRDPGVIEKLVICTNASLETSVSDVLDQETKCDTDIYNIFKMMKAKCYRFNIDKMKKKNKLEQINELLKQYSDCGRLAKLLAECIFKHTKVELKNLLFAKYRTALVETLVGDVYKGKKGKVYHVKDDFFNTAATNVVKFRKVFEKEYKMLMETQKGSSLSVKDDMKNKGILVSINFVKLPIMSAKQSLPKPDVTESVIKKFFDKFILVCDSPHEKNLSSIIMDCWKTMVEHELQLEQLGAYEKDIANQKMTQVIFDWMKKQSTQKIVQAEVKKLFEKISLIFRFLELKSISTSYQNSINLDNCKLSFDPESLSSSSLCKFIESDYVQDLIFEFNSFFAAKYSLVLVAHLVIRFTNKNFEPLFVDSKTYNEKKVSVEHILRSIETPLLIVIACSTGSGDNLSNEEKSKIAQWNATGTKIIFINKIQNANSSIASELFTLQNLTEASKKEILKEHDALHIFGTKIALEGVVHDSDNLLLLLEMLETLKPISKAPKTLVTLYKQIETWYIQRVLALYDQKTFALTDNDKNIHKFSMTAEEKVKKKRKISGIPGFSDETNKTKVHILLDEAGFGKSTYLTWLGWYLQRQDASWWIIRFNSIDYSTDFKNILESKTTVGPVEALRTLFVMIHLALFVENVNTQTMKKTDEERNQAKQCAVLLNIVNGCVVLDEDKAKTVQLTALQVIELRLFQKKFSEAKLIILFDAFDEIVPTYKGVVYNLINQFSHFKGIAHIYLSSRPYDLKTEFVLVFQENAKFYQMEPFSEVNRLQAIHGYLKKEFSAYAQCDQDQANFFLFRLESIIKRYLGKLGNTPLYIRLALRTCRPLIEDCVNFTDFTIAAEFWLKVDQHFEKLNMIESFIKDKLYIANLEKAHALDVARITAPAVENAAGLTQHIFRMHGMLALFVIFEPAIVNELLLDRERAEALEYMEKIKRGSNKSGLIEGVAGDDKPLFIHQIFAEYFVAYFMNRNRPYRDKPIEPGLASNVFWDKPEMRDYLNRMLIRDAGKEKNIHKVAANGSVYELTNLLHSNPKLAEEKAAGGRTVTHLMAIQQRYFRDEPAWVVWGDALTNLGQIIIDSKDDLLGWSALDYAFMIDNQRAICELIRRGASLDITIVLKKIIQDNPDETKRLVLSSEKYFMRFKFSRATTKYMLEVPQIVSDHLINNQRLDLNSEFTISPLSPIAVTPITYCVQQDAASFLEHLLMNSRDHYLMLENNSEETIHIAFDHQSVNVLNYLLIQRGFTVPTIDSSDLFSLSSKSISSHNNSLFKTLFDRLCATENIEVINIEQNIEYAQDETPAGNFEVKYYEALPIQDIASIHPYILELLCVSVCSSNIPTTRYIISALGLKVDNELIFAILKATAWYGYKHYSYDQRSAGPLKYLIDQSSNLHATDEEGQTLLHITVEFCCVNTAKYLIEQKQFDVLETCQRTGMNAIDISVAEGRVLQYKGFHQFHGKNEKEMFVYLIERPVPVYCLRTVDAEGRTILERAITNDYFLTAQFIVEKYLEESVPEQRTPLHLKMIFEQSELTGTVKLVRFMKWLIAETKYTRDTRMQSYRDIYKQLYEEIQGPLQKRDVNMDDMTESEEYDSDDELI